jgi:thiosulfate/3-mercaptopyruvate sulfurtransferase
VIVVAAPHTTLITAEALRSRLDAGEALVIIDAGFDLADTAAGERAFMEAHLPGARYVHLERDLSAPPTGRNGRHPLPERAVFAATAGRLGITPETQVVVYDRQASMFAARVWWMLRWLGHAPVAVLDGGWSSWQAIGGALESGVVRVQPKSAYPMADTPSSLAATIDADALLARLGQLTLIDARAPERFRGDVEPLDAQAGHIPGACNRFFKDNLTAQGRFKPAAVLRAEFLTLLASQPAGDVVNQCGSGVTACHNLLAMTVAGLEGSVLYPGSWSEWSSNPHRPTARG